MRLELLTPPVLVTVDGRPALLLARRADRSYVQLSLGPGINCLRWVASAAVRPPGGVAAGPAPDAPARTAGGLPWLRPRDLR